MKTASILLVMLLSACSTKNITNKITENTKRQVEILKQDIKISKCNKEIKTFLIKKLDIIKHDINNIAIACNTEKQVLTETITKLKIIIISIAIILIGILYLNFKRNIIK